MSSENFFNNARGAASAIQVKPPFAFSDVKMTIFPIQANLTRLTQFCDGYLNQANKIAQFKPFLPFVYLILLDYGRMSAAAAQTGWVSQREVAFGIPLRWLKPGPNGPAHPEFHDLAFTTPFIFVDNEVSLTTGREVYGWPKLLARLDPTEDDWIRDPHGARQVFEIRSRAAADNLGDDLKAPFLSVTQMPVSGLMDFPPRLDSVTRTIAAAPNAMMGVGRFWRDALMTALGVLQTRPEGAPPISGFPKLKDAGAAISQLGKTKISDLGGMATGIGQTLSSLFPSMYSNTINLKQFRDAAEPGETCYQALTAAKMPIQRFGGGGLLGSQNMLAGQFDGGYRVHIMNTSSVPLVASLGLIPTESREIQGGVMSSFAPICPFWCDIDMYYGTAETLAYRGRSGDWKRPMIDLLDPETQEPIAQPAERVDTDPQAAQSAPVEIPAVKEATPTLTQSPQAAEPLIAEDASNTFVEDEPILERSEPVKGSMLSTDVEPGQEEAVVNSLLGPSTLSAPDPRHVEDDDDGEFGEHPLREVETTHFQRLEPSNPFNTTRGASEALGGRFRFPGAKIRVLPLLAKEAVLRRFVSDYLDVPGHMRAVPWGRYVYMMASNYENVSSDLDPSARFDVREVTFGVPVKYYEWDDKKIVATDDDDPPIWAGSAKKLWKEGTERLLGTAIVTPFNYVDDMGAAITESEVFGVPSLRSVIESPSVGWDAKHHDEGVLLETKAMVVPMLGVGAEGKRRTLMKVRENPMIDASDTSEWNSIAAGWGDLLAEDLNQKLKQRGKRGQIFPGGSDEQKDWIKYKPPFELARGGALRLLSGLSGIDTLGLKQFRDAWEPAKACYKGIVSRKTTIQKLHSLEEIDKDLTVSILRFPTHPLAKILGLIPKRSIVTEDGVCDEFEPIRPFTITADMVKERGRTLYERVADEPWTMVNLPKGMMGWQSAKPSEVEEAHTNKQKPHLTYIWTKEGDAVRKRFGPETLTDNHFEEFKTLNQQRRVSDLHLLHRDVPLGTMWRLDGLRAMDEGRIDDLNLFARTRMAQKTSAKNAAPGAPSPTDDEIANMKTRELAGALELISPATVIDSILSRGWGSQQPQSLGIRPPDFHLRRLTLGPHLGETLFPELECQQGAWPRSGVMKMEVNALIAARFNQFTNEIRFIIEAIGGGNEETNILDEIAKKGASFVSAISGDVAETNVLAAIAKKSFPAKTYDLIMNRNLADVLLTSTTDIDRQMIRSCRIGVREFFDQYAKAVTLEMQALKASNDRLSDAKLNALLSADERRKLKWRWLSTLRHLAKQAPVTTERPDELTAARFLRKRLSDTPWRK